jgi:hypothetical protein
MCGRYGVFSYHVFHYKNTNFFAKRQFSDPAPALRLNFISEPGSGCMFLAVFANQSEYIATHAMRARFTVKSLKRVQLVRHGVNTP